ncbi:MAG TPA: HD domain-containing protein [Gemmataceae bacterium]|jgi:guanosine-3',5'-bis(diphosphate) 3'-pyrophosphohydrolase|nr:HD domain-containing protein [Gemmataceae bacterium]
MAEPLATTYRPLLEAVAFAARAHHGQLRKDGQTPYVSHVFRVTLVLREVFGIDDRQALTAAVLHDTVEDTTTDFDDLEEKFGADVAAWVAMLSKDKRRQEQDREAAYVAQLASAPWQVKVCKLADVFDNLMDSANMPPEKRGRVFDNSRRYLDALKPGLPEQARRPWDIVSGLLATLEPASPLP